MAVSPFMLKKLLIIPLLCALQLCHSQISKKIDSLCAECNKATSDTSKVLAYGELAEYYSIFKLDTKADSILQLQLMLADLSNNESLLMSTLFSNTLSNINSATSSQSFENAILFVQKGITYAKSRNNYDEIALGLSRLADVQNKKGESAIAMNTINEALSYINNIKSDSVRSIIYIQLGDINKANNKTEAAFKSYTNANDFALKGHIIPVLSTIYHKVADIYKSLNDSTEASTQLHNSLTLDKENKYNEGLITDYIELAKLSDNVFYIDKALELAESSKLHKYILQAKRLKLAYYYVSKKDSRLAMDYMSSDPDLKQYFINTGMANFFFLIGNIFNYSGNSDSALYYYRLAEPNLVKNYVPNVLIGFYKEVGQSYSRKGDFTNAIDYYSKALELSSKKNDENNIVVLSDCLSRAYEKTGNYQKALLFSKSANIYKLSLQKAQNEKVITLLAVDEDRKRHELAINEGLKKEKQRRDLQYMAITIAISVIFAVLLFIGAFPVSKATIRMLGYFFFISVFEFIVMLIDNFVLKFASDQPLKLWLIKIALIALLVPFQHYLEHGLTHFLESRKLILAREKLSLRRFWNNIKKPPPINAEEGGIEEDTAVL